MPTDFIPVFNIAIKQEDIQTFNADFTTIKFRNTEYKLYYLVISTKDTNFIAITNNLEEVNDMYRYLANYKPYPEFTRFQYSMEYLKNDKSQFENNIQILCEEIAKKIKFYHLRYLRIIPDMRNLCNIFTNFNDILLHETLQSNFAIENAQYLYRNLSCNEESCNSKCTRSIEPNVASLCESCLSCEELLPSLDSDDENTAQILTMDMDNIIITHDQPLAVDCLQICICNELPKNEIVIDRITSNSMTTDKRTIYVKNSPVIYMDLNAIIKKLKPKSVYIDINIEPLREDILHLCANLEINVHSTDLSHSV